MNIHEVLLRPVVTEKTTYQSDAHNQYTFEVHLKANKMLVTQAVEQIFNVTVQEVRVINVAAHRSRNPRSRIMGKKAKQKVRKPGWKKAIVKLAEGERLELFEGV